MKSASVFDIRNQNKSNDNESKLTTYCTYLSETEIIFNKRGTHHHFSFRNIEQRQIKNRRNILSATS